MFFLSFFTRNRAHLRPLRGKELIQEIPCEKQFMLVTGAAVAVAVVWVLCECGCACASSVFFNVDSADRLTGEKTPSGVCGVCACFLSSIDRAKQPAIKGSA